MQPLPLPIGTSSLRLRPLVVEDALRMMALNGEPSTRRWLPSHVYGSAQEATERMAYLIACYTQPGDPRLGPFVLAVDHLPTGELIGHVGFSPFEGEVEVSYAIAEAYRGCHLGAEALACACAWAVGRFGLRSLLALTESDNAPSRRTLERAGFVHGRESVMRFQWGERAVCQYRWRPGVGTAA